MSDLEENEDQKSNLGRFPSNVILEDSEEVIKYFPILTNQAGNKKTSWKKQDGEKKPQQVYSGSWRMQESNPNYHGNKGGSASMYFKKCGFDETEERDMESLRDNSVFLHNDDCLDIMKTLPEGSFDSIVTDPPYFLGFMGKEWDKAGNVINGPAQYEAHIKWAREALRVAKPGAYLLAFGGPRTYHRLACAIEDAGWEIRDCIMWVYGCLSEDTEILTNKGWARYSKDLVKESVLCYDKDTDTFVFDKPIRDYFYGNKHTAYRIESDFTDQLVSRNHRVLVERNGRKEFIFAEALQSEENVPILESLFSLPETISDIHQGTSIEKQDLLSRVSQAEQKEDAKESTQGIRITRAKITPTAYSGNVWCVEVSTGAFVARRNGKIFITGNSGFPKSMNIGKEIEKRRASNDVIRPWLKSLGSREEIAKAAEVTPRQVDHWLGENTPCPQTLTEDRFLKLCEYFKTIPEWADDLYQKKGEKIGEKVHSRSGGNDFAKIPGSKSTSKTEMIHLLSTEEAKKWDGWGTALKPAYEPIIMARKPIEESTVAGNVLKYGTGGINIDECRVPVEKNDDIFAKNPHTMGTIGKKGIYGEGKATLYEVSKEGRFPANVMHDGSEEVVEMFPYTKSGKGNGDAMVNTHHENGVTPLRRGTLVSREDDGSAARFFYSPKASQAERDEGLDGFNDRPSYNGVEYDRNTLQKNNHPTVKPISLMRYLVRLVTPKGGMVLDPFMGSGSTGKAAILEDMRFTGIEKEKEYFDIACARIGRTEKPLKVERIY